MIKPNRLNKGDKVAIVSLSSGMMGEKMFIHRYEIAKKRMEEEYGLEVVTMPNALKGIKYLYNHPEKRAEDLMNAFSDKTIKGIFCAIGGEDGIRLLPYINFDIIKNNPKIFAGFSDTTTHHFMLHKAGLVSYYGASIMNNWGEYVRINDYTNSALLNTFFNPQDKLNIPCSEYTSFDKEKIAWGIDKVNEVRKTIKNTGYEILQGKGKVQGELLGGCADVFMQLIGTPIWPSKEEWKNKILLLETSEFDLSKEHLTWLLRNLYTQGIFDVIKGIIVGKPPIEAKFETYKKVYKQVVGVEANHPELPILYNVNVGHAYPIGVFGLGLNYEINCEEKTLTLLEKATI